MARGENPVVTGNHPVRQLKELNTRTDDDKLSEYLNDPDPKKPLSKKLKHLLERQEYARDILNKTRSYNKTVIQLMKKEWQGETISQSTARRDLDNAQKRFGAGIKHDRKLNIDFLLEDLKKDAELARQNGDMRAVAAFRKLQLDIINDHMGDSMSDLYKDLQPHIFIIDFIPDDLKTPMPSDEELQIELENLRRKKGSSMMPADDVSFEEIEDGE
jgi:hypothetical protein